MHGRSDDTTPPSPVQFSTNESHRPALLRFLTAVIDDMTRDGASLNMQ